MDTHNKRLNYLNRFNLGQVGLVPNGTVEMDDLKNYLWLPIWLTFPEPEDDLGTIAVLESRLVNGVILIL